MQKPARLRKETADFIDKVVQFADDLIEQGYHPNYALAKAAYENKLDVSYLPLAVRAINTASAIAQLKTGRDAWEKAAAYPVATIEKVREHLEKFTKNSARQINKTEQEAENNVKNSLPIVMLNDDLTVINLSKNAEDCYNKSAFDESTKRLAQYCYTYSIRKYLKNRESFDKESSESSINKSAYYQCTDDNTHKSDNIRAFNLYWDMAKVAKEIKEKFDSLDDSKKTNFIKFVGKNFPNSYRFIIDNFDIKTVKFANFDPFFKVESDKSLVDQLCKLEDLIIQGMKLNTDNFKKWACEKPDEIGFFDFKKKYSQINENFKLNDLTKFSSVKKFAQNNPGGGGGGGAGGGGGRHGRGRVYGRPNIHAVVNSLVNKSLKAIEENKEEILKEIDKRLKSKQKGDEKGGLIPTNKEMLSGLFNAIHGDIQRRLEKSRETKDVPSVFGGIITSPVSFLETLRRHGREMREFKVDPEPMLQLAKLETLNKILKSEELKPYPTEKIVESYDELFSIAPIVMTIPSQASSLVAQKLATGTLPLFELTKLVELEHKLSSKIIRSD